MDTSHLGSTMLTIPNGSTLLCPKLFWMICDLIPLKVFTFSMVMLLAPFHFENFSSRDVGRKILNFLILSNYTD